MPRPPSILRAGLTILAGSAGGTLLALALTPAITRLISPEGFGIFATISAAGSVFVGLSTGRLEVRAMASENDEKCARLLSGAVALAMASAVILTAGCGLILARYSSIREEWLLLGPLVLLSSLQLIATANLARARKFGALGLSNFAHHGGAGVLQVTFLVLQANVLSLLLGFLGARLVWLKSVRWRGFRAAFMEIRENRDYLSRAGGSALVNSLSSQLPILLPAVLLGASGSAAFAMAMRLLLSPLSLIGQAVSSAAMGELGRAIGVGDIARARAIFQRGVKSLFVFGLLPASVAVLAGPYLVPWVLGEPWRDVGSIVAVLAGGALCQFAVAPFSQSLNMLNASTSLLVWDFCRLLAYTLALGLPVVAGHGIVGVAASLSCGMIGVYVALYLIIRHHLQGPAALIPHAS